MKRCSTAHGVPLIPVLWRPRAFIATTLMAAVIAVAATRAQTPSQAPPPPVFHAGTLVVEVEATVFDRRGRFLDDLARDDFELWEGDRQVTIDAVYLVAAAGTQTAAATPAASNAAPRLPPPSRVFVLVVDSEHLSPGAFARLQSAAQQFLDGTFRDGDLGGVIIGGTLANGRLTTNRDELRDALRSARPVAGIASRQIDLREWPRLSSELEAVQIQREDRAVLEHAFVRACEDDPEMCVKPGQGVFIDEEDSPNRLRQENVRNTIRQKAEHIVTDLRTSARRTLALLASLLKALPGVEGRKSVVFVSEGFFVEQDVQQLQQITAAAARASVTFYSMDARGLNRTGSDRLESAAHDDAGLNPEHGFDLFADGPNSLAVDTGGYIVRNTNDFAGALAAIGRDAAAYYVLGYRPSAETTEGDLKPVRVKVRREGVSVRARPASVARAAEKTSLKPDSPAATAEATGIGGASLQAGLTEETSLKAGLPGARIRPAAADRVRALSSNSSRLTEGASPSASAAATRAATLDLARDGWSLYERGDVEGARHALRAAARDPSAPAWVRYALGQAAFATSRVEEAARAWEQVRAAVPEFRAIYFDLVDAYLVADDPGRAIAVLRAAEARWPSDVEVLNALGVVQVRRGALDDGIESFREAASADPNDGTAHFNLGKTYELRYYRSRRWSQNARTWLANDEDRRLAFEHYRALPGDRRTVRRVGARSA